jgi:hypothetical protein
MESKSNEYLDVEKDVGNKAFEYIYKKNSTGVATRTKAELSKFKQGFKFTNVYEIENVPQISPMASIQHLVETTYYSNKQMEDGMKEQLFYLNEYVYTWRPIAGDGNCFYRSVIFYYLENIIFEKNIKLLQDVIIEIADITQNPFYNTFIHLVDIEKAISILILIYNILTSKESNINQAYDLLILGFNSSMEVDITFVYYLRCKLYTYINENRDKYYSESFHVKLGNLLPSHFETQSGDFMFDSFFSEELMKPQTYAEKICVYLIPYILKCNLHIVYYDFGSNYLLENKMFGGSIGDIDITLIYRRTHYDIIYSKKYYEKYCSYLDFFRNKDEQLKVLVGNNLFNEINLIFGDLKIQSHNQVSIKKDEYFCRICGEKKELDKININLFSGICITCLSKQCEYETSFRYKTYLTELKNSLSNNTQPSVVDESKISIKNSI